MRRSINHLYFLQMIFSYYFEILDGIGFRLLNSINFNMCKFLEGKCSVSFFTLDLVQPFYVNNQLNMLFISLLQEQKLIHSTASIILLGSVVFK